MLERDFRSTLGGNMRCNNFLIPKVSYSFCRSKHKVAEKLLENVDGFEKASVSKRSKLLGRVSVFVDYDGLDDIINNERAAEELFDNRNSRNHDFDISLVCKRFPSISLGHSPPMKLYDGANCSSVYSALLAAKICEEVLPSCIDAMFVDSEYLYEACTSLYEGRSHRKQQDQ